MATLLEDIDLTLARVRSHDKPEHFDKATLLSLLERAAAEIRQTSRPTDSEPEGLVLVPAAPIPGMVNAGAVALGLDATVKDIAISVYSAMIEARGQPPGSYRFTRLLPGEPACTFRGRDPLAPETLLHYAHACGLHKVNQPKIDGVIKIAEAMEAFPNRRLPD